MEKLIRLYPLNSGLNSKPSRLIYMGGETPSHAEAMARRAEEIRQIGEANEATKAEAAAREQLGEVIKTGDGKAIFDASMGLAGALWDKHVGPIQHWAGEKALGIGQTAVDAAGQVANKMGDIVIDEAIPGPLGTGTVRASARLVEEGLTSDAAQTYAQVMDPRTAYNYYAGGKALEDAPQVVAKGKEVASSALDRAGIAMTDAAVAYAEVMNPSPAVARLKQGVRDVTGVTELQKDLARTKAALAASLQGDTVRALAEVGSLGDPITKRVATKTSSLNVRENPSLSARAVGTVAHGDEVIVNVNPPAEVKADGYVWNYSNEKGGWIAAGPIGKPSYLV